MTRPVLVGIVMLVGEDDQADPKVGATVAQKMVDAKVAGEDQLSGRYSAWHEQRDWRTGAACGGCGKRRGDEARIFLRATQLSVLTLLLGSTVSRRTPAASAARLAAFEQPEAIGSLRSR